MTKNSSWKEHACVYAIYAAKPVALENKALLPGGQYHSLSSSCPAHKDKRESKHNGAAHCTFTGEAGHSRMDIVSSCCMRLTRLPLSVKPAWLHLFRLGQYLGFWVPKACFSPLSQIFTSNAYCSSNIAAVNAAVLDCVLKSQTAIDCSSFNTFITWNYVGKFFC